LLFVVVLESQPEEGRSVRRGFLAVGVAGLTAVGSAAAIAFGEAGGSRRVAVSVARSARTRPPAPVVSTLGVSRSATIVSYCWTQARPGGAGVGGCADGTADHPDHRLRWRPGATVTIDLRLPAHGVTFQTERISSPGRPPGHTLTVSARRVDRAGRQWIIRLPARAERDTDLLIFATFANGDVFADLGLQPAQGGQAGGVQIQQSYDRHGNPSLIANANAPGSAARPRWSICTTAESSLCAPVPHVRGVATSAFLDPGTTAPGTVFQATLVYRGKTYVARTGVWEGTVHAVSPPTLTGSARFHAVVVPHRAIWTGGWAGLAQPEMAGAAGGPPNLDELNVEACRTPTGQHCVNLTEQGRTTAFSHRPPMIDNWFTGWHLFAFDQRIAAPEIVAEPGYSIPSIIPVMKVDSTHARSLPLGPVTGPPIPRVAILHQAIPRAGRVLIARVRCAARCAVSVWVSDRHTGSGARVTLIGSALVGVPARRLRHGRLDVLVHVGAGPEIAVHPTLR
jgi:hypothetical protein